MSRLDRALTGRLFSLPVPVGPRGAMWGRPLRGQPQAPSQGPPPGQGGISKDFLGFPKDFIGFHRIPLGFHWISKDLVGFGLILTGF